MIEVADPQAPEPRAAWDAYVASRPESTCHHLSAWAMIAERVYGLRARLLLARAAPESPVRGVLPLISVPRPLGRYVTTGLFGAHGPLLADGAAVTHELVESARRITEAEAADYLHIKALGDTPAPAGFARHDVWVTARLALDGGADRVWRSFKSSIRAAVRQALRAGLDVRSGYGLLDAFYDVLAENMHRKGSPIYGLPFMRALLEALGARADVVTLWKGGTPISGALTVTHHGVLYVPFASSRAAYFPLRPNNLLYWRIIERACEKGFTALDFGSSLAGGSALAFKLGWGAVAGPAPSYVYAPKGARPTLAPRTRAARTGVALWKRLPRAAADALGPQVCRFLV